MGMSDVDIDMHNAYADYNSIISVSMVDAMHSILKGKYDRELIKSWLGDRPLANTSIRVWARHTDLPGDPLHERKEFRMILDDNGNETHFILKLHADKKMEVEPYKVVDYDYTNIDWDETYEDEDDDEYYSEGDY